MAIYNIVKKGDSVLRKRAKEVSEVTPQVQKLIKNMAETMYKANGVGLAAPQVGFSKRVIVVDIGDENGLIALINPVIVEKCGTQNGPEGCLSCPEEYGDVLRAKDIVVQALNENGEAVELKATDFLARAIQHEIDHLDGILFVDKATNLARGE